MRSFRGRKDSFFVPFLGSSSYRVNFPYLKVMRPYRYRLPLVITLLLSLASANGVAQSAPTKAFGTPIKACLGDPLTKSGLVHLYDLEYDKAIADFQKAVKKYPFDPFAYNHLIQGILLKELYRLSALDTTLYADDGFLTGKPLPGDPDVKKLIMENAENAIRLSDERLKEDASDVDALYARGVTKGYRLSYVAIVEKSFFAALKNASSSRSDHERVLDLNPNYVEAKLIVGAHNYVLGSMPLAARIMAGVIGMGGSKRKGLDYLYDVANSKSETSADARVTLALFLRREGRYKDALEIMRTLTTEYPRNFLFGLEEANLLKDSGLGVEAVTAYQKLVSNTKAGKYGEGNQARAIFGLGESLKGQRQLRPALDAYQQCITNPSVQPEVKIRALLAQGELHDALGERDIALRKYAEVISIEGESPQAAQARKHLRAPFRFPNS